MLRSLLELALAAFCGYVTGGLIWLGLFSVQFFAKRRQYRGAVAVALFMWLLIYGALDLPLKGAATDLHEALRLAMGGLSPAAALLGLVGGVCSLLPAMGSSATRD